MLRSRRGVLRLLGGAAFIPIAATVGAQGEAAASTAQNCEEARRLAAADYLTLEEVRWLEEHRGPEGFEVTGCVELDDGAVAPRMRRTLP